MNSKKKFTIVSLFIGLTFLAGCAQFRQPPPCQYISWKQHQKALRQFTDWTMEGALSITHNKKRDAVRFRWAQKQNSYTIDIFGPLNISSVRIIGNPKAVEFLRSNKECIKARTPEELTKNQLGWQLPISNIRYWILALPAPGAKVGATNFDQYGHLVELNQSGWQIKYFEFQLNPEKKIELPKIIELTNKEAAFKIKVLRLY